MPLESILHNKCCSNPRTLPPSSRYTVESDVWAFGVLLWEIFAFALQPYYGLTNEQVHQVSRYLSLVLQVVQYIKDGHLLECPENTPKSVYRVMTMCWNSTSVNRPCFR